MKKIIYIGIFLCLFCFSLYQTNASFLSQKEEKKLDLIKKELVYISQNKPKEWFEMVQNNLSRTLPRVKNNTKMWYIVSQIQQELFIIESQIFHSASEDENIGLPTGKKIFFENFYNLHSKNITTPGEISQRCTEYYDFIDEIAKRNNFPTALIIATWSKEFNCNLSNPNNGWGPYQITSNYYTPGAITLEQFGEYTQEFIEFSKGKWSSFERNPGLRERFGIEKIEISYDFFTLESLQLHAILYNGVTRTTTLETNLFANGNLHGEVSHNSDGLITRFLKILDFEIKKI